MPGPGAATLDAGHWLMQVQTEVVVEAVRAHLDRSS
jgi:hypothetical protein